MRSELLTNTAFNHMCDYCEQVTGSFLETFLKANPVIFQVLYESINVVAIVRFHTSIQMPIFHAISVLGVLLKHFL